MATQMSMGLTKVALLVGAGFTGSVLFRNGRLSDVLAELQMLVKGLEKSAEESGGDSDYSDALAQQVRRLAMEVRQLASARPITVLNGSSGYGANATDLIIPAATVGALGYGYMWWKGISFSDLMYVTKRNMANAVSSMTKHLEQVSAALAATKRHLTQRIEGLDGKLDEQKEMSQEIKNEVVDARGKLANIGNELTTLQQLVWGLNGKMNAIEDKQDFACNGVMYLCQFVEGKGGKMTEFLKDLPKSTTNRRFLGNSELKSLKGLQQLAETIKSENFDNSKTEALLLNDTESIDAIKGLPRTALIKC